MKSTIALACLACFAFLFSPIALAAPVEIKATDIKALPFDLTDVRLLDGPFKTAQELDEKYLLTLDADRLLVPFRQIANLPVTSQRYGGWELQGLASHSLGHYLSACALMYAATGDARFKEKADYVVMQLAEVQAANGNGYAGGVIPKLFDDCFAGGKLTGWAPWYTLHKTFAGLIDANQYCQNAQAIDVATKFAGWVKAGLARMTPEQIQKMLDVEHGGMNEAMANLYAITADPDHLALAKAFYHKVVLDPLADGKDPLTRLHVNTQIPKIIGAARIYELTGDPRFQTIAQTFWNSVAQKRSFVTGSNSNREHFFALGREAAELGPEDGESCNVYNMLKLTKHVFGWEPSAAVMDYYERAVLNHILGSIDPDTGMTTYFQALNPGHFKVYGTPADSFWCCTGTGMENHARYGESIYFHDAATLWVNLFIASELNWKQKDLIVRQTTDFPREAKSLLTFKTASPAQLTVSIRVPYWATAGILLTVNGEAQKLSPGPSGYVAVHRVWKNADTLEISMPMNLHLYHAPDDKQTVAMLYGPLVLAGQLGRDNFPADDHVKKQGELDKWPGVSAPALVTDDPDPAHWLKAVEGQPLAFQTTGVGKPRDVQMIPLYQLHHQRYAVYWKMMDATAWANQPPSTRP